MPAELARRELRTLADCQALWRGRRDPLALLDDDVTPAPAWLVDGLLWTLATLLGYGDGGTPEEARRLRRRWRERVHERRRAARAWTFATARVGGLTRAAAAEAAARSLEPTTSAVAPRRDAADGVSPGEALERDVRRFLRLLARDPWVAWAPPENLRRRLIYACLRSGLPGLLDRRVTVRVTLAQ